MKIYKQETNKSCGIACLRSILNHYGNTYSEKDIWDKHISFHTKDNGVINPILSLGVTALKFGFGVKYIGYNPIIISNNFSDDLKKSLQKKSKTPFDYENFYIKESLKFLELNGTLKIDILSIEKIRRLIDENKFALVEIKPIFLNKRGSINRVHKIIIIGYNNKGFKILDPSDAKDHIINFDTFLLAFYAAGAELLIIKNIVKKQIL